jgi:hypothetical protein
MQVRTFPGLVLPLVFIACAGHSTPAAPSPAVLDLVPGSYALTLNMSQSGDPVCTAAGCFATSLCFGNSAASTVRTVTGAARLERAGDAITIRPDDPSSTFRLDLQITGTALTGTASGQFRDNGQQLSVEPRSGAEVAAATGTVMSASVAGKIDGEVSSGGYGCSNNGHGWTLTARRP